MNRKPFAHNEWYHCYTRGVDKRKTFQNERDYQRFLQLLYLANNDKAIHRSDLKLTHKEIFAQVRGKQLVSIAAFCLMPNHFHIVMSEAVDGGISRFMQKVGIAYTMYFNIKNKRVGNLFVKPFRSKHIANDEYLKQVVQYIHLNPLEVFEPEWKHGHVATSRALEMRLRRYSYSSLAAYESDEQSERAILDPDAVLLAKDEWRSLSDILQDTRAYYAELSPTKNVKMLS